MVGEKKVIFFLNGREKGNLSNCKKTNEVGWKKKDGDSQREGEGCEGCIFFWILKADSFLVKKKAFVKGNEFVE